LKEATLRVHQTVIAGECDERCAAEDVSGDTTDGGKRKVEDGVEKRILDSIRGAKKATREAKDVRSHRCLKIC